MLGLAPRFPGSPATVAASGWPSSTPSTGSIDLWCRRRRSQRRYPGPLGSIGKLQWTQWMNRVSDVVPDGSGPRLVADTGEWGTFAWACGMSSALPGTGSPAGPTRSSARSSAENVLGLPAQTPSRRDRPYSQTPR